MMNKKYSKNTKDIARKAIGGDDEAMNLLIIELPSGVATDKPNLKTQAKEEWTLADAVKQGDVVLCFFPLAFSGVCETEMKCVNDEISKWQDKGAQVVGISCDSFFALKAWADQLGLKQTLLADMHRTVCKAYGLHWEDLNVSHRGTIVIGQSDDGQGTVKWAQTREPANAMDFDAVLGQVG